MKSYKQKIGSTSPMDGKIIETALKVRFEMENFATNNRTIGNPVTLSCYCAIASYSLNQTLKKLKFDSHFITGLYLDPKDESKSYHCWVELDNHVVDITATQFGIKDRVNIVSSNSEDYAEDLRNRQATRYINENWICNQTIKHNLPKIKEIVKSSSIYAKKFIFS